MPLSFSWSFHWLFTSWGRFRFGNSYSYPPLFSYLIIPLFILTTLISVHLTGGYKQPARLLSIIRGLFAGSVVALVIYALLPAGYRFSRAVIVLGSISSIAIIATLRIVLSASGAGSVINPFPRAGKTAIVSGEDDYRRLSMLILSREKKQVIAGRIVINPDDLGKDVLGSIGQIRDIIKINRIGDVIFSTRELTASQLIESMQSISDCNIEIRIAPPGEKLLLGSKNISSYDDFETSHDQSHMLRDLHHCFKKM